MEGFATVTPEHLAPLPGLLSRLRQLEGYTWDDTRPALHSSYDSWCEIIDGLEISSG